MKKLTVLIVEDDVFKYHQVKAALSECCLCSVSWAESVEQALQMAEQMSGEGKTPDLIITDMHYPIAGPDTLDPKAGLVLISRLKEQGMNVPVVICSSVRYELSQAFACIWYSPARSLSLDLREVVRRL